MDNYIKLAQAIIKEAARQQKVRKIETKLTKYGSIVKCAQNLIRDISPTNDTVEYSPEFRKEMDNQLRRCFSEPGSYERFLKHEMKFFPQYYEGLKQRGIEAGIYPTPKPPKADEATFMKDITDPGNSILNFGKPYKPDIKDSEYRNQKLRTRDSK
ncbi:MAG: hypothetical protein Q4A17_08305 [Thermoguttaceae bacterium]|nr:hypothetical protein [Thermoguttaceae bacterium]